MTFREYAKSKLNGLENARNCKNIEEFKMLAKGAGISWKTEEEVQGAYDFVKNLRF